MLSRLDSAGLDFSPEFCPEQNKRDIIELSRTIYPELSSPDTVSPDTTCPVWRLLIQSDKQTRLKAMFDNWDRRGDWTMSPVGSLIRCLVSEGMAGLIVRSDYESSQFVGLLIPWGGWD